MPCIRRAYPFLFVLICLIPQSSLAFTALEVDDVYSLPLPEFDLHNYSSPAVRSSRVALSAQMSQLHGGNWEVYSWNPQTDTPRWIYGTGFDIGSTVDLQNVESIARTQLELHRDLLRADPADLRFDEARYGRGQVGAHFQQTYEGLDVQGGTVRLVFHESGRLFVLGSNFYSGIELESNPTIGRETAERIATQGFAHWGRSDEVENGTSLLVLPVPVSETQVDHRLVWQARVRTENPLGIWVTHVDAHTGEVVFRYNDIHFADYVGSCGGQVQSVTWCDGEEPVALRHMQVQVAGVGATESDADGNWVIPNGDDTPRSVTSQFYGRYADVSVYNGTDASFSGVATPGVPLAIEWDDTNARQDERDVYEAVSDVIELLEKFDTSFVDNTNRILARVNMPGSCNAYWDGRINFYPQSGSCANSGEVQGVVCHEYGHDVQFRMLGWQGDQGLGEGNSDVLANLITQEPIAGRGMNINDCTGGSRSSKNTLTYPDDVIGEQIHYAGQVIAGFHWDALELFQLFLGSDEGTVLNADRWHYGRWIYKPTTQPDQVLATFLVDDDDGNLDNGTPNYDVFCVAAANHGFDCPPITSGVLIAHDELWDTETEGDRAIVATIESTVAPLDSAKVVYRINGSAFGSAAMIATGQPDEYQGVIPNLASPDFVEYYIRGVDTEGNARNYPPLAPYDLESFDVALIYDPAESEAGWTVNLEGTDDATAGIWERVDPNGTLIQPEDDATPDPGTMCWITGQAPEGGLPNDNDVDDGTTSLYSPVFDLTGLNQALIKYNLWFHNSRGLNQSEDPWRVFARNDGGAWLEVENTLETTNGWEPHQIDLLAAFGGPLGSVEFKFVVVDWIGPTLVDAGLDDFKLLGSAEPSSVEDEVSGGDADRYALFPCWPNPVSGRTRIRFQVPTSSRVDICLYDVGGREILPLARGTFQAGTHEVEWNGRDEVGKIVPSGVYFYRMTTREFEVTRSMILQR